VLGELQLGNSEQAQAEHGCLFLFLAAPRNLDILLI